MRLIVNPGKPLHGEVTLPGDKSLSHRAALFAAMAEGESVIHNFLVSGVTRAMLGALTALGVAWRLDGSTLTVEGRGLSAWKAPAQPIDCGNSATTLRLLAGAVAAAGVEAVLTGSEGLRRRPMDRITAPLRRMGVEIAAAAGETAPLRIAARPPGQKLSPLVEDLPVASAQVKSCLLLAALAAEGETVLSEPGPSRDHTERMLAALGIAVETFSPRPGVYATRLRAPAELRLPPLRLTLPGDISSAAFLIAAGLLAPASMVTIRGVGLNPTRTGLLDALRQMGADLTVTAQSDQGGEPVGDLTARSSVLRGIQVCGPLVVRMIDEFSVFGAAAACADGVTEVREASELRYKESDRIATLCNELSIMGVVTEEWSDGFRVFGAASRGGRPAGGSVQAHGDHRLAMAMAVVGLASRSPVIVEGAEMMDESFPGFAAVLKGLGADVKVF